ncbi:DUF1127 domain-containing protein [Acuticoccus sp. MNP-M23]|uniref:DUF1127 domain-containing protein n=1 Tax=Acuticoccus sp. MNP-M23 TaxID=3072793 RepID=UPI002814E23D|nr:DUF1127 domain-containing protein [Acuticoccus sp. MNP-M23]WMS42131.1 DUF1127 domain-containing protein [Acuticoccus sp. MNP-M23]
MIGTVVVKTIDAAGTVGRGIKAWWNDRHKRRALAQLSVMSPSQLDDIGLTQALVDAALQDARPAKALALAYRKAQAEKARERLPLRQDNLPVVAYYHPANVLKSLWF